LSGATTYWLVIQCDNQTTGNLWRLCRTGSVYSDGTLAVSTNGTWGTFNLDLYFKIYTKSLQSYSESTIKTQGNYALKVVAAQTDSLNKTLTKTFVVNQDLTGVNTLKLDMRASRTGANIKLGLHDTGGMTTELTPTIVQADTYQTVTWDISGVSDANKDAIDTFIITVLNADSANTVYFDNFNIAQGFSGFFIS